MPSTNCPVCDGRVYVDPSTEQGDILICEDCDSSLELVGLDPIELDPAMDGDDVFEEDFDDLVDGDDDDDV